MHSKGDEEGRGGGRRLALPLSEGSQPARHPPGPELSPQALPSLPGIVFPRNPQKTAAPQPHYLCCSINTLQAADCTRTLHEWGRGDKGDPACTLNVPGMVSLRHNRSNSPQFLQHQHPIYPAIPRLRTRRSCRLGLAGVRSCPCQRCPQNIPGLGLLLRGQQSAGKRLLRDAERGQGISSRRGKAGKHRPRSCVPRAKANIGNASRARVGIFVLVLGNLGFVR